jgi:CheY-like chemotaxis protein/two-component sensor histidine kinase
MLLGGQADAAAVQRATTVIYRNAKMQQRIIEDILDVSRIITGQLRIDLQPLDLRPLIEHSVDVVRPAAAARRIGLHITLARDLAPVAADAQRLQQVIWNLLSNAVKFTPEAGRVDVRLARTEHAAVLTVLDTGPGIDPEFLPYIFDRFRQADSTSTRSHGGLGLGLAIVRHLVELHGGTVTAANRTDREGAVFTLILPMLSAATTADTDAVAAQGSEAPLAGRIPRLEGLHVLAVDDDADSLDLVSAMLTMAGASVTTALSGAEGLASLERRPADAIVCDIGMPGEDGYAFVRSLRGLPDRGRAGVAVIALTAYVSLDDQARARHAGFDAHLAKPVDAVVLCETVRRLAVRRNGPRA